MSLWLKVTRPQIEMGTTLTTFQAAVINLEQAEAFALGEGHVAFFIDGKGYYVQQAEDPNAYQAVLVFARKMTDNTLS